MASRCDVDGHAGDRLTTAGAGTDPGAWRTNRLCREPRWTPCSFSPAVSCDLRQPQPRACPRPCAAKRMNRRIDSQPPSRCVDAETPLRRRIAQPTGQGRANEAKKTSMLHSQAAACRRLNCERRLPRKRRPVAARRSMAPHADLRGHDERFGRFSSAA